MISAFELLMTASIIGAIDVLYYHLYRYRLYERAESVREQVTHLLRQVLFLAIVMVLMFGGAKPWTASVLLGLFALDLINSSIDVLLERGSRASLGGLPPAEYLLHIFGTLFTGMTIATVWWKQGDVPSFTDLQIVRGWATLLLGTLVLAVEASLFAAALTARRSLSTAS